MANDKPNPYDILLETGFGHDTPAAPIRTEAKPRLAAPASELTIKVKIEDIQPYDQNPRRAPNPKYEGIKESIRDLGLRQQISITKRPNDDFYMVQSGGNTRLKALKELYAETGEERFGLIECKFVPYTNEKDLLSLHIMENEQRAAMLFIDVAVAAQKIKAMLEAESGKNISLRALEQALAIKHSGIRYQHLTYYLYGAEIADELPKAFAGGLGRPKVETLKKLEDNVEKWAQERNKDVTQAVQYFRSVLKEKDAPSLSIDTVESKLFERLSREFQEKYNDVRNAFIHLQSNTTLINYSDEDQYANANGLRAQPTITGLPEIPTETPGRMGNHIPHSGSDGGSIHVAIPSADLDDLKGYIPPEVVIPSSNDIENKGATPQEIERNKLRYKLRDYFNSLISKIHKFDQAFTVTNDEYILISELEPNEISNTYDPDELAAWYALHIRAEMLRIAINGQSDLPDSRRKLQRLSDPNYLNANSQSLCVISNLFITHVTNILPKPLRNIYSNGIKPEVVEIFEILPALDNQIKAYLTHLT